MLIEERINSLIHLNKILENYLNNITDKYTLTINTSVEKAYNENNWFTKENIIFMFSSIKEMTDEASLKKWVSKYQISKQNNPKKIGVIMAGNIPLVGFHDLLSVFISGHIFMGKTSSKDTTLYLLILNILKSTSKNIEKYIKISEQHLTNIDAIIATGSDNSARYFDYYFGKYPNIIRKNRSSIAIIDGKESEKDLQNLTDDIFIYFGLGCRNVSKLYIPRNYDLKKLIPYFETYNYYINHTKYANNYEYHRAFL